MRPPCSFIQFRWPLLAGLSLMLASTAYPAFAANESDFSKQLVGVWATSATDKESGDIETTLIQFNADGTYRTRLQSKLFGETKQMASGRYAITNADKDSFTLNIEVLKGDPELDKADAVMAAKMRMPDANTLQSEDGQVVRRMK